VPSQDSNPNRQVPPRITLPAELSLVRYYICILWIEIKIKALSMFVRLVEEELSMSIAGLNVCSRLVCM
jgi:hypothetical protein